MVKYFCCKISLKIKSLTKQDEVKAAFFNTKQVTVHPTVAFVKVPNKEVQKIVITHLSDITQHDAHIVHFITSDCIKHLSEMFNETWKKIYIWSDGSSSQFKGKTSFYYLGEYDFKIERNFFGTEHGKSESDAVTGVISKKISNAIKSRLHVICNAKDMLEFLTNNSDQGNYFYKLIKDTDMEKIIDEFKGTTLQVLTGKCTRTLHQIKPCEKRKGSFLYRPFSCFCINCKLENFKYCKYKDYTKGNFKRETLKTANLNADNVNEEIEDCVDDYDLEYDFTQDMQEEIKITQQNINRENLKIGNFIVIKAKDENVKEKHVVQIYDIEDEDKNIIKVEFFKNFRDDTCKVHYDVYVKTNPIDDIPYDLDFDQIVMLLPEPTVHRRGGKFYFSGNIFINKH